MASTSSLLRRELSVLVLLAALASPSRAGFEIQDLGALTSSGTSNASAINAKGQAAGVSNNVAVSSGGFGSKFQAAGVPSGAQSSFATGINQGGSVCGNYTDTQGMHGYLAAAGSPVVTIAPFSVNGVLGGATQANGINSAGTVVGTGYLPSGVQAAFRASGSGNPVQVAALVAGGSSMGNGINDSGTVIGSSQTASGLTHAFTSSATGTVTDLSSPSTAGVFSFNTFGTAISSNGAVVGYGDFFRYEHAFYAPAAGSALEDLGVVAQESGGSSVQGMSSYARGVNGQSNVVGSLDLGGGASIAFLWSQTQGMIDLNSLLSPTDQTSWQLLSASAINDDNQIVGQGYFNGQLHAFELMPDASGSIFGTASAVPAPPTLVLSAVGFGIASAWSRIVRRRKGIGED